jgi:sugar phosphate isomerase/epimerase
MYSRRKFIQSASLYSAGILGLSSFTALGKGFKKSPTIGLQLYTVRDAMAKDPVAALAKVAAVGFNSVEGATYTGSEKFYGMDPKAFAAQLKSNGLTMYSSHYRLGEDSKDTKGTILNDWDRAVADAHTVGIKYMVCAFLSNSERGHLDHYKQVASELNEGGRKCKEAGIQLCYHNHDFEFQTEDGKYPYDILLDETDKDLVKMELDLYWATKAGQDPVAMFEKHPGRFPLWHMKDMDNTPQKAFTEVGSGVIDFKKIYAAREKSGMKYFFVEQDRCPGDPFDSITKSYNYIKTNIVS